jgi:hypothetical protein
MYDTQEQAACARDRTALVFRGASTQLNYHVGAYLHPTQQLLLTQLRAQAVAAAAAPGSSVPQPVLPEGDAGMAAIRAEAAREVAVAASAGAVLLMPPKDALLCTVVPATASALSTAQPLPARGKRVRAGAVVSFALPVQQGAAAPAMLPPPHPQRAGISSHASGAAAAASTLAAEQQEQEQEQE